MYLAYIDETYTDAVYSFAVFLVPEARDAAMQREVLSIAERFARHGIEPDAELHGSDLFHSRRGWRALRRRPALRVHAYRLGLKAVETCGGRIVFVSTKRAGTAAGDLGLARLQAVERLLVRLEAESERMRERCLLIFDEVGGTDRALVWVMQTHHRNRLLSGVDPRIVQAPGIVRSDHVPGIQIADLAAFLFQRRRRRVSKGASGRAIEELWRILEPKVLGQVGP